MGCLLYDTLLDANVGINHLHDMVAFMGLHVQLILYLFIFLLIVPRMGSAN